MQNADGGNWSRQIGRATSSSICHVVSILDVVIWGVGGGRLEEERGCRYKSRIVICKHSSTSIRTQNLRLPSKM